MNLIENGKNFENVLTLEELESIQGGHFCIKFKTCNDPSLGSGRETTCGILIGKVDEELGE